MLAENTYIMNLEACYIYKDIIENKVLTYKNRDLTKLFAATIPYSLETIRIDNMFPNTFYIHNDKQYTRKIVNLSFEKHYTKWDNKKNKNIIISNRKKIRKLLYKNGFIMDGIRYVFYKRGAGKAKNGFALFIDESMRDVLIDKSRLGIKFEHNEKIDDYTSLLAYESLISSGLEYVISLNPKTEILLIDDIYGMEFENMASVTREKNKNIITKNEVLKIQNCLSDGQGLLDESVFEQYGKKNKGFKLLRNDMFKCCAFNTKLQKWFDYNNITHLTDMFGVIYDAKKIKLVITPNSLKFLKFAYKISDGDEKKCYEYWKNNVGSMFGVVKNDKNGNYGNYNRATYQLLNSIPYLTYDDLLDITKIEREYVMMLKNDNVVFRNYLTKDAKASLKLSKYLDDDNISLFENTDLMNALILINPDVQYTSKFKKLKTNLISNYIENLKKGKIRLKDTKYVTIISNPYEMLLASIGKYSGKSIMIGREVFCKYYKDGENFCATRNPHINAGNVMYTTNKYRDVYDLWFNFTDNICAINFYDNDAPDRLQGCDTDSDTILLIPHKILAEKAKMCEQNFPTPINKVEGYTKPKKYNMSELQKLDVVLSNNYIGKIVNMSQIINSYLNHAIFNNEPYHITNELYQTSSQLSSMSQIEIDKSKKVFDNISMAKELAKMKKLPYIKYVYEEDIHGLTSKKMIVPNFFSKISEANNYRIFEKFDTPMDILQDILVFEVSNYQKGKKNKDMVDLLLSSKEIKGRISQNSVKAIFKIVEKCGKTINGLKLKSCTLNSTAKKTIEKKSKKDALLKLKKLKPSDTTILYILKQCFGKRENDIFGFKKYGMLTLNLLFIAKKIQVLKCFRKKELIMEEVLIKIDDGCGINIFGEKYHKTQMKNLI